MLLTNKLSVPLALSVALLAPALCAQKLPGQNKNVADALKDATYVLRRFDDVSGRVDFTQWQAPNDVIRGARGALNIVKGYSTEAKDIIARLNSVRYPSSGDLLDIMFDLGQISSELSELSNRNLNFNKDDVDTVELARVSSEAQQSEANLYGVLVLQLATEEATLKRCADRAGTRNRKPSGR